MINLLDLKVCEKCGIVFSKMRGFEINNTCPLCSINEVRK